MKRILFLGLIITLIIGGCTQQKSKFPQGAWQLVSAKQMSGDTIVSEFPGEYTGSDIVIFSEQHILSVGRFKRDTTFIDNYVGATYKLDGNRLEETLLYFPNSNMVGKKVKQILELRKDTLIKTYPYNDNWELIKNGYTIEKLVRLK
jgi:FlaG/FlaF family flagellin (archaellin)